MIRKTYSLLLSLGMLCLQAQAGWALGCNGTDHTSGACCCSTFEPVESEGTSCCAEPAAETTPVQSACHCDLGEPTSELPASAIMAPTPPAPGKANGLVMLPGFFLSLDEQAGPASALSQAVRYASQAPPVYLLLAVFLS